ncbi:hypothetical protein A0H81_02034 [Grifola frondosa]|uniref:Uncharacterized protein n=1 Tax=Grifola frondosa TaxID=5627 RepID=A0A1C7MLU1_GRIFR|nr:hypothetical protein A0H81_02034 [Grifola frondosa]
MKFSLFVSTISLAPTLRGRNGCKPRTDSWALMVGGLVSCVVYGVTCSQTVVYFQRNQNDRLLLKLLVFSLWLLDTADVLLNGHALYWISCSTTVLSRSLSCMEHRAACCAYVNYRLSRSGRVPLIMS